MVIKSVSKFVHADVVKFTVGEMGVRNIVLVNRATTSWIGRDCVQVYFDDGTHSYFFEPDLVNYGK